jgi:hypothetical protein
VHGTANSAKVREGRRRRRGWGAGMVEKGEGTFCDKTGSPLEVSNSVYKCQDEAIRWKSDRCSFGLAGSFAEIASRRERDHKVVP